MTAAPNADSSGYLVTSVATMIISGNDPLISVIRSGAIQFDSNSDLYMTEGDNDVSFVSDTHDTAFTYNATNQKVTIWLTETATYLSNGIRPFLGLTWVTPDWATKDDTFDVSLQLKGGLAILAVPGRATATWTPYSLSAHAQTRKGSALTIVAAPAGSTVQYSGCTDFSTCYETASASGNGTPQYELIFNIAGIVAIGIPFTVAVVALIRNNLRLVIAVCIVIWAPTIITAFYYICRYWGIDEEASSFVGYPVVGIGGFFIGIALFVSVASPFLIARRLRSVREARMSAPLIFLATTLTIFLLGIGIILGIAFIIPPMPLASGIAASCGALAAVALGLTLIRINASAAIIVGLLAVWTTFVWNAGAIETSWMQQVARWSCPVLIALAASAVLAFALDSRGTIATWRLSCAVLVVALLASLRPSDMLFGVQDFWVIDIYELVLASGVALLLGITLLVARSQGNTYEVYRTDQVRGLILSAVALALGFSVAGSAGYKGLCAAAVLATLLLAVPKRRGVRAAELGAGSMDQRRALLLDLAKQRVLQANARALYRDTVSQLVAPDVTPDAVVAIERRVNDAVRMLDVGYESDTLEQAFAAPPGTTPWRNGFIAGTVSLMLGAPFLWIALRDSWQSWLTSFQDNAPVISFMSLFGTSRIAFFGFVYGYFYPQLRGVTTLSKSLQYAVIVVPADLFCAWLAGLHTDRLAAALAIEGAQQTAILLLLGVVWELRAMRSVHLPWSILRSFRGLRSLAAPVSAAIVAAVTAVVTTFATTYAQVAVTPPISTPTANPSSSSSSP